MIEKQILETAYKNVEEFLSNKFKGYFDDIDKDLPTILELQLIAGDHILTTNSYRESAKHAKNIKLARRGLMIKEHRFVRKHGKLNEIMGKNIILIPRRKK